MNQGKQGKPFTEFKMWHLIEKADWGSDHDYDRISKEFHKLPVGDFLQLRKFIHEKESEIGARFHKDWLGNPGIDVSDDSWSDLCAEVIGRGEAFYKEITAGKLRVMAKEDDFVENFCYCVQCLFSNKRKDHGYSKEHVTDYLSTLTMEQVQAVWHEVNWVELHIFAECVPVKSIPVLMSEINASSPPEVIEVFEQRLKS
jgi:hypothetical protein